MLTDTLTTDAQQVIGAAVTELAKTPITWQHIMLTVIGALMVNLMNYEEFKKSGDRYGFVVWIDKNWISLVLSALSLVVIFMLKGEIRDIAGFDMSNRLGCFLAGFTAHAFTTMMKDRVSKKYNINA